MCVNANLLIFGPNVALLTVCTGVTYLFVLALCPDHGTITDVGFVL